MWTSVPGTVSNSVHLAIRTKFADRGKRRGGSGVIHVRAGRGPGARYELRCVSHPRKDVAVLSPSTSECDLIWTLGPHRRHRGGMRSLRWPRLRLAGVLVKRRRLDVGTGTHGRRTRKDTARRSCEGRVKVGGLERSVCKPRIGQDGQQTSGAGRGQRGPPEALPTPRLPTSGLQN